MPDYSIRDLAQISGVKAHTIRTWELRYQLLRPCRSDTNIRSYSEQDLRRLLQVASLCSQGQRISQVMKLSEQACAEAVLALGPGASENYGALLNALLAAMLDLDEPRLRELLDGALASQDPETVMLELVYPLLQRVGAAWQVGALSVAQEHLLSHLIRQKLVAALDALPARPPAGAPRWLLFLPEGELHELALLFMTLLLRRRGQHVLYLGQSLPLPDAVAACQAFRPAALLLVLTAGQRPEDVVPLAATLRRQCPEPYLVFYGPLARHLPAPLPERVLRPTRVTDLLPLIPLVSTAQTSQA